MRNTTTIYFDPITITRYMEETGKYETETYEDESLDVDINKAISRLGIALASALKIGDKEAYERAKAYIDLYESTDPEKWNKIDMDNDLEYKLLCKCFSKEIRNQLYRQMDKDYTIWGNRCDYVLGCQETMYYNKDPDRKLFMQIWELDTDLENIACRHTDLTDEEKKHLKELRKHYDLFVEAYNKMSESIEQREYKSKHKEEAPTTDTLAETPNIEEQSEKPHRNFKGFVF